MPGVFAMVGLKNKEGTGKLGAAADHSLEFNAAAYGALMGPIRVLDGAQFGALSKQTAPPQLKTPPTNHLICITALAGTPFKMESNQ